MSELNIKRGETQAIVEKELANRPVLHCEPQGSTSNIVQTGLLGKPSGDNLPDKLINSLGRFIRGENVILSKPRGLDYEPGGAYESLGNLSGRLKGVTDSGQAKELFRGVKAEFESDDLQLGWLSEVEAIAFPHEPLPVEFGGAATWESKGYVTKGRGDEVVSDFLLEPLQEGVPLVPVGKLSLLAGRGGIGKSLFLKSLVRAILDGEELFWHYRISATVKGKRVLYLSKDELDGVRTDLAVMGCKNLDCLITMGDECPDTTIEGICKSVSEIGGQDIGLIVIDTGDDFLGAGRSGSSSTDVKTALNSLVATSRRLNVPSIVVSHVRKKQNTEDSGSEFSDSVLGSVAWVGKPRQTLLMVRDSENQDESLIAVVKSNVSENRKVVGRIRMIPRGSKTLPDITVSHEYGPIDDLSPTVKRTVKDEVSEAAINMASIAGANGFTQIELVNSTLEPLASDEKKARVRNQVSRAVRSLVDIGKLCEFGGRYYHPEHAKK